MHLVIWGLALVLIALWSLVAWVAHTVLGIDAATLADVDAWVRQAVAQLPGAVLLDAWWPKWREVLGLTLEGTRALLGAMSGLAPWLVGAVWAAGAIALLGAAGVASLLWRWLRPRPSAAPQAA